MSLRHPRRAKNNAVLEAPPPKIGDFQHSIIPFGNIVMTKEQKEWTMQLEHAGEVMSLEVQAGLDGFRMIGEIRINRGIRDPVRKALWMPEGIVGDGNIKTFEDAEIDQLLMSDKPYIHRKERTIQMIRQDNEETAEEDEIDSITDEFELLEIEDLDE
ncbi:hypothetical protein GCK72_011483 [Caenorhabditis remanei]|uniref:Uncharacterized protein n=1 Tax=Caenorhabditis remanei TaxID=31234 RepID=A0A6A5H7Q8_CAERE|nr:hypothetical protein GCK72_011483 [Caenorhabditis remanei]KAF1763217.1 hypothetical protein GCK72_011483 [Caenorhabditis remanei]